MGLEQMVTPEIGYVLSHAEWGKGCMTEVLQAVMTYLFSCGYSKISAPQQIIEMEE